VLGQAHQSLRRDPDVADVLDVEQRHHEFLESLHRDVGHVAAGYDHVADLRCAPEVLEHLLPALVLLDFELVLQDLQRVVADQVHPGAMAAVLRACWDQLGEHLRRVAVGEALDRPHVRLVQRVAGRQGMARPFALALRQRGRHVVADRVVTEVGLDHRIDHLRRDQHRHRRALLLIQPDVLEELVVEEVAEGVLELLQVLHRVGALPLRRLPLLSGDVAVAGQPRPVRFDELTLQRVREGLIRGVGMGLAVRGSDVGRLWTGLHAHGSHLLGSWLGSWLGSRLRSSRLTRTRRRDSDARIPNNYAM
jgi:hypothetical protein